MDRIKRKYKNYVKPFIQFLTSLFIYYISFKKENICIVLADFAEYGGTRTYFEQLCRFLKDNNQKVICLVSEKQKDNAFLEFINKLDLEFEIIPDKQYVIEYSGVWSLKIYLHYFGKLLSDLNLFINYCIKHKANSFFISTGEPEKWLFLFWLPVTKMFYVLHTLAHRNIGSIGKYTLQKMLSSRKKLVTVSHFSEKTMTFYWKLTEAQLQYVSVIYNFFESSKNTYFKNADNCITVLTLGHVVSYKDPFTWIKVAEFVTSKLPNTKIQFAWAGDGELFELCKCKVINNSAIRFLGYIKDVEELYSSADIYFQPSLQESHGIAVLGAMCNYLPCIVSDTGGLSESVRDKVNGYLVQSKDVETFSKRIMSLANNHRKRIEMGENSKAIFNEQFDKVHWLKNMFELYMN